MPNGLAHFDSAEGLSERSMFVRQLALILQLRQPYDHALACRDVANHLHQEVLNKLERCDRFAKLFAGLRVCQCIFVGTHLATNSFPCNEAACHAKHTGGIAERGIVLQAVLFGHLAVLECDQPVLHNAQCHLVMDLLNLEAGGLVLYDEALHLAISHVARPDDGEVTPRRITDPLLLTVQNPGVTLPSRGGQEATGSARTYQGLRQTKRTDLLEARHWGQPLLLLLFRPTQVDRSHREAAVDAIKGG